MVIWIQRKFFDSVQYLLASCTLTPYACCMPLRLTGGLYCCNGLFIMAKDGV